MARVLVATPLPHLDRPFDYLVPADLAGAARPGARVKVRFAGRDLDGVILERVAGSEHSATLAPLRRVVSPEPVLAEDVARLLRLVADRYAGTAADVLRLAVPPRHADVERRPIASVAAPPEPPEPLKPPEPLGWSVYSDGVSLVAAVASGRAPRVVWIAPTAEDWAELLAVLLLAAASSGRGALAVCPTHREVLSLDAALSRLAPGRYAVLTAEQGPRARYRAFLDLRRGLVPICIGTRAAAFAPVRDLGLVAIWDDGADTHAEPRAPYPHAREVLLLRAHDIGAAAVVGGFACTPEAARLVESGWARAVAAPRARARSAGPTIRVVGDGSERVAEGAARHARLPPQAWRVARDGLLRGPVLVQVPRTGYLAALACRRCRSTARCPQCTGPLRTPSATASPACAWCGRAPQPWRCPACGHDRWRAAVVGAGRTAEELGRAFPGVPLVGASAAEPVKAMAGAGLVVATPGSEPPAADGYAAALILDAWATLGLPLLRAGEEALRRWLAVCALVRPAAEHGSVLIVGADPADPVVQALVRHDPTGFARTELDERRAAGLPPARRWAEVTGDRLGVADLLERAGRAARFETLGPVPIDGADESAPDFEASGRVRALLKAPPTGGVQLAEALRSAWAARTARRLPGSIRIRLDPVDLG